MEISDDSLWLLEDGVVTWQSDQALASIADTVFVDLPPSTADLATSWASKRPSMVERMNAEVLTLKVFLPPCFASLAPSSMTKIHLRNGCLTYSAWNDAHVVETIWEQLPRFLGRLGKL